MLVIILLQIFTETMNKNITYCRPTYIAYVGLHMYIGYIKLNPWRYSSEEPRPTEAVAARRQYRGLCG